MPRAAAFLALALAGAVPPGAAADFRARLESRLSSLRQNPDSLLAPGPRPPRWNNALEARAALALRRGASRLELKPYAFYEREHTPGTPPREERFQARWDEAYVDHERGPFYFLAGKKRVNWGVGFFANPVDAVNPLKDRADPARAEEGAAAVLAEAVRGGFAVSALYSPERIAEGRRRMDRAGGSVGGLAAGVEWKLMAFGGETQPFMAGGTARGALGRSVLYGELARRRGGPIEGRALWSGLAGLQHNLTDRLMATAEYIYDERGSSDRARQAFLRAMEGAVAPSSPPEAGLPLARQYAGLGLTLPQWRESWDFAWRALVTLDRPSWLAFVGVHHHLTERFSLGLEAQKAGGGRLSEFGQFPLDDEVRLALRAHF